MMSSMRWTLIKNRFMNLKDILNGGQKKSHLSGRPIVNDFLVMVFFGTLKKLVEKWIKSEAPNLQNDLLCGTRRCRQHTPYDHNDENGKKV